jgi:excisionase family DNA binding protein
MLAARDVELAQETARELRAQGQPERAQAIEAVLGAALAAQPDAQVPETERYLTPSQVARAMGMDTPTVKARIIRGEIPSVRLGGQVLVRLKALQEYLEQGRLPQPATQPSSPAEIEAAKRQREFVLDGLPGDKVTRVEALHAKLEAGERLSRAERSEMIALERVITQAASQRLGEWIQYISTPPS